MATHPLAALVYGGDMDGGDAADALVLEFCQDLQRAGWRVGGLAQQCVPAEGGGKPRLQLVDMRTGRVFSISQDLGPLSRACCLDPDGVAQAGGVLCFFSGLLKPRGGSTTYLAAMDEVRIGRPALAGETIVLECRLRRALRGVVRLEGRATAAGALVAEAKFTVVIRDTDGDAARDDPRNAT